MTHAAHADGQSQWKLIGKEFAKRKLALLSAAVIFLLIQASIWAPFLANDRPLMMNTGQGSDAIRSTGLTASTAIPVRHSARGTITQPASQPGKDRLANRARGGGEVGTTGHCLLSTTKLARLEP